MRNSFRFVLSAVFGLAVIIASTLAISAVMTNHSHDGTQQIDHRALVDGNGCHHSSGGYHCH